MSVKIRYLYHSGFTVETAEHFLIFDYWKNTPKGKGLEAGVIDPAALADRDVIAFASHRHGDHFNREILTWDKEIPRYRIVLSDDIRVSREVFAMAPGATLVQPDMTVRTLASNDEGVAFIVEIDGLRIYHAGDLNWWHWEGEPDEDNEKMGADYCAQIALLEGMPIDLAFVPVDPRLEGQYALGLDYLMMNAQVRYVVPMHFGDETAVVEHLLRDPISADYRDKIIGLTKRGETAELPG